MNRNLPKEFNLAGCGISLLIAAVFLCTFLFFTGTRRVDAGEVCIKLRFGDTAGVAEPGLHFVIPFVEDYRCYLQRVVVYEVSNSPGASNADYTDFSTAFNTPDGQEALANYTLIWRIDKENVDLVYRNTGQNMDEVNSRSVKAISRSRVRLLAGRYTADQLFSGRLDPTVEVDVTDPNYKTVLERLQEDIAADLRPRLAEQGVTLVDFLLRKFTFNEEYVNSREQLGAAQAQADRQIRLAEADARQRELVAEGDAKAIRTRADAQAYALETLAATLEQYPPETAQLLVQLQFMESFEGQITWGVVPEGVNPFIQFPVPSGAAE